MRHEDFSNPRSDADGLPAAEQSAAPSCPRCGAAEVAPVLYDHARGIDGVRAEVSLPDRPAEVGEPGLDLASPNWSCAACGAAWPDQARLDRVAELRAEFALLRERL